MKSNQIQQMGSTAKSDPKIKKFHQDRKFMEYLQNQSPNPMYAINQWNKGFHGDLAK